MKTIILAVVILLNCIGCKSKKEIKPEEFSPNYTILNSVDLYTGKGKCGEVLIPSVSRVQKTIDREK